MYFSTFLKTALHWVNLTSCKGKTYKKFDFFNRNRYISKNIGTRIIKNNTVS